MSLYTLNHNCGYDGRKYLQATQSTVIVKCPRCLLGMTAHRIDSHATKLTSEKDGVIGVMQRGD